ncbi:hypothetical protein GCM10009830_05130 [Glycomyces endophyticus]|uniref:DUF3618 domain-containing protein n=1 Tax=Glycomyces endophyticus TaxID=480996 RepID=A0ABN2FZQ8_9ACTN
MAGLLEVAAKIAADKEQVAQLAALLAAMKDQAEQTAGAIAAVGVEQRAADMRRAAEAVEEAEALRLALEGGLEKARWQAMSAVHGKMGPGARGSGPGGAFIAADGTVITSDGGSAIGHLDAVPPHVRQDPTPSGQELTGVDPTLSPFQKEHEGASDDTKMGKLSRFGRKAVRNTGDLVEASKNIIDARANTIERDYDPWGPTAHTITETPTPPSQTPVFQRSEIGDVRSADVVGTSIVVAVIAVEGLSRILRKRKHGE